MCRRAPTFSPVPVCGSRPANSAHDSPTRRANSAVVVGSDSGLFKAARADRHVSWVFVGPAAGPFRRDAARMDAGVRCQSCHDRTVRTGRHALHGEIPVGAADRRTRRADFVAPARSPPRLAGVHANSADGGDRISRAFAILPLRRRSLHSARCLSLRPRQRRTSWSMPSAWKAFRKTSRPPAWRLTSPPIASAC